MYNGPPPERNQDATLWVGELDQQVTESLLWELFLQAGPIANVHIPRDKLTSHHGGFGFVEYQTEEDADYALKVLNMIKLFGRAIRVNKASKDRKSEGTVGANLFVGNLSPEVDEPLLYNAFSAFGALVDRTPKVARDPETGDSKGYAFVFYDNFESSDAALQAMNGQFLGGRPITVSYALKKDSKTERHGSMAERMLAAANPKKAQPNTMFSTGPTLSGPNSTPIGRPPPTTSTPTPLPPGTNLPPWMVPNQDMPPPPFSGPPPHGFMPNLPPFPGYMPQYPPSGSQGYPPHPHPHSQFPPPPGNDMMYPPPPPNYHPNYPPNYNPYNNRPPPPRAQ